MIIEGCCTIIWMSSSRSIYIFSLYLEDVWKFTVSPQPFQPPIYFFILVRWSFPFLAGLRKWWRWGPAVSLRQDVGLCKRKASYEGSEMGLQPLWPVTRHYRVYDMDASLQSTISRQRIQVSYIWFIMWSSTMTSGSVGWKKSTQICANGPHWKH